MRKEDASDTNHSQGEAPHDISTPGVGGEGFNGSLDALAHSALQAIRRAEAAKGAES